MEKTEATNLLGDSIQQACSNITLSFFYFLDNRRYADVAALMAPDGVWVRQGAELKGGDAIMSALEARPATRTTCHIVSNIRVEVSKQPGKRHARVLFYLTAYDNDASSEEPGLRLIAIRDCCDELIETGQGWRIQRKSSRQHLPVE